MMKNESSVGFVKTISLVLLAGTVFFVADCRAKDVYTFGIVPQQAASALAKTWVPILKYLEQHSGYKLQFETTKDIPAFEKNLANGKYDFAYINPYHYVMFHTHSGYMAFAKAKDKKVHGIIVVHKDSPVRSIYELNNKVLVFPSPLAFAASMIPRSELTRKSIKISTRYVTSHDSVYRNVADKNFIAGGGVIRTFNAAPAEVRNRLRILYKTNGYTPHAFAALQSINNKVLQAVRLALIDMDKTVDGKRLLDMLKIKAIGTAKDADWDDVRKINF